jgi:hypothetical protein
MALNDILNDILDTHENVDTPDASHPEPPAPSLLAVESISLFDKRRLEELPRNQDQQTVLSSVLTKPTISKSVAAEVFTMVGGLDGEGLLNKMTQASTHLNMNVTAAYLQDKLQYLKDQEKSIYEDFLLLQGDFRRRATPLLACAAAKLCVVSELQDSLKDPVFVVVHRVTTDLRLQPLNEIASVEDILYDYSPFRDRLRVAAEKVVRSPVIGHLSKLRGDTPVDGLVIVRLLSLVGDVLASINHVSTDINWENRNLTTRFSIFEDMAVAEKLLDVNNTFLDDLVELCKVLKI